MDIPLEVVGAIVNSGKAFHCVMVSSDEPDTGGFIILEWWPGSNGPNEHCGFDAWVSDELALHRYFRESDWQVEWLS